MDLVLMIPRVRAEMEVGTARLMWRDFVK